MSRNFVDFAALKAAVSIDAVAEWLQLELKKTPNGQLRGCCPMHNGGNDREFVITPSKGLFFCFGPCGGGDCIKLAAQVLKIGTKEAAQKIAEYFEFGKGTSNSTSTVDRTSSTFSTSEASPQHQSDGFDVAKHKANLEKIKARLVFTGEVMEALKEAGLSEHAARATGIGYDPKQQLILQPIYINGEHVDYSALATKGDQAPLIRFYRNLDQLCAAPPLRKAETQPTTQVRKFLRLRIVK